MAVALPMRVKEQVRQSDFCPSQGSPKGQDFKQHGSRPRQRTAFGTHGK